MKYFLCLISLSLCSILMAQHHTEHKLSSDAFGKERRVRVFLPERYEQDSTTGFAVCYVLDAQSDPLWDMATGTLAYLIHSRAVIPMIAVGIVSDNRSAEFNPPAEKLLAHFEQEVFPLIDSVYRVNSVRALIGHSWGGIFIAQTLFGEKRDLFTAYLGVSPVLGYQENMYLNKADSLLQTGIQMNKFLYCSTGDVGTREEEFVQGVEILDSIVHKYENANLIWEKALFEGHDHWSCVAPSINDGLVRMSRQFWAEQTKIEVFARSKGQGIKEQVVAFNKKRDSLFGYHYMSSPRYLKFMADEFAEREQFKAAFELYDWTIELDPKEIRNYMAPAWQYERSGQTAKAVEFYQAALEILVESKDEQEEAYFQEVKTWLEEKLAELK